MERWHKNTCRLWDEVAWPCVIVMFMFQKITIGTNLNIGILWMFKRTMLKGERGKFRTNRACDRGKNMSVLLCSTFVFLSSSLHLHPITFCWTKNEKETKVDIDIIQEGEWRYTKYFHFVLNTPGLVDVTVQVMRRIFNFFARKCDAAA